MSQTTKELVRAAVTELQADLKRVDADLRDKDYREAATLRKLEEVISMMTRIATEMVNAIFPGSVGPEDRPIRVISSPRRDRHGTWSVILQVSGDTSIQGDHTPYRWGAAPYGPSRGPTLTIYPNLHWKLDSSVTDEQSFVQYMLTALKKNQRDIEASLHRRGSSIAEELAKS